MKITAHIVFWLGVILVMSIVVPGLMGPTSSTDRMTTHANQLHDLLIVKTGVQHLIDRGFTTKKQLEEQQIAVETQTKASVFMNRYMQTVSTELYGLVFRGCIMAHWLIFIGAF